MTKIPSQCPGCGLQLRRHCSHCSWRRCQNKDCGWTLFDFIHGVRVDAVGKVERMEPGGQGEVQHG